MKTSEAMERFLVGLSRERKAKATVETYVSHVRQFLRHRIDEESEEFREFLHEYDFLETRISLYLSHLAANRSAAMQSQALNAIVCFYRLIGRPVGTLPPWVRPKHRIHVPTWVTIKEARAIIQHLPSPADEVASMMIGSGLRIGECLRLRGKDIDLERRTVTIHGGKGDKSRVVMLAASLVPVIEQRIALNRALWMEDRASKRPGVALPDGLERKIPRGGEDWPWFWLWPAPGESVDPESKIRRRHHRCAKGFSKSLAVAVRRSGVPKRVTAHAFRHGFATAYIMAGGTLPELQDLMGHENIQTTEIYMHCIPQLASRVSSPLDSEQSTIIPIRRIA